jgi:hypothetical protein
MATIKSYNQRFEALKSERSSFISLWKELSDYQLSYRGRFLTSDRNKGHKRNTKQYNNTPRLAVRTLASGMMAGITSPARPWFRLTTGDKDLNDSSAVKAWLHSVEKSLYQVFAKSNTYNSLHQLYSELGVFGTGCMGVSHDFDNVIRCKTYTVGQYCITTNGKDEVDTFYREYEMTVAQCVHEFGIDNVSSNVKNLFDKGNTEAWIKIMQVVEPNDNRDMISPLARDKLIRSVYYEVESGNRVADDDRFLRRSGFDEMPILAPRWNVAGEDIYATDCPGMDALGDTKALQLGEKDYYTALDKVVNPPLQGPSTMQNKINGRSVNAGDIVWTDSIETAGLRPIYEVRPDLNAMKATNVEVEHRIKRAFYEDLFLALTNTDRRQITAREVAERHEEKLLMLGPVLERLHTELLNPLIDRTFNILARAGVLPVPPRELQGKDVTPDYVSVLAQAQKIVATGAIEQVTGFAANIAPVWPDARHKINIPQAIDSYSDALGIDPNIIRSDDEVAAMVEVERQAQAQAAASAQGQQLADTAKTMSDTDVGGENALATVMQNAGLSP